MSRLCMTCGHDESDHYTYCLNGRDQQRCKKCDPFANRTEVNIEMQEGSETHRLYHFADHDFVPMLPLK